MREVFAELISNLIGDLDIEEIEDLVHSISTIIGAFKVKSYSANTIICHEGAVEDLFYVITKGAVAIEKTFDDGEKKVVATLTPGQFFGEMSLILDEPRSADVVTTSETVVLELTRKVFDRATRMSPRLTELISNQAMTRTDDNWHTKNKGKLKNPPKMPNIQIFTSYSSKDIGFVSKFVKDLQQHVDDNNIKVWLDQKDIPTGSRWDNAIWEALRESQIMLLVMSGAAVESDHVADEWSYHLDTKKMIIPILIEPCDRPPRIHRLQYIDFTSLSYSIALARVHKVILDILTSNIASSGAS